LTIFLHLSGRRELNSLPSPWQGDILPVNYARFPGQKPTVFSRRFSLQGVTMGSNHIGTPS
jgi:hypothetical protein